MLNNLIYRRGLIGVYDVVAKGIAHDICVAVLNNGNGYQLGVVEHAIADIGQGSGQVDGFQGFAEAESIGFDGFNTFGQLNGSEGSAAVKCGEINALKGFGEGNGFQCDAVIEASIRYMYKYVLSNGNRTPRYIIRDIIEPTVYDYLFNTANFPSKNYTVLGADPTLHFMIESHVNDMAEADRLYRILAIWGNGKAEEYEEKGKRFISGVDRAILDDLTRFI